MAKTQHNIVTLLSSKLQDLINDSCVCVTVLTNIHHSSLNTDELEV